MACFTRKNNEVPIIKSGRRRGIRQYVAGSTAGTQEPKMPKEHTQDPHKFSIW